MNSLRVSIFQGMIPQVAPRVLSESNAQVASNVKLTSSELQPLRGTYPTITPNKPLPAKSIFLAHEGNNSAWMSWPYDVDVVRSPLPADVESRYYWTGDGEPRFGRYEDVTAGGGNDYPHSFFALGIPTPVTAPTVTPSGGSSTNVTRFYCYTFVSQFTEESAPSPVSAAITGHVDGTFAVTGMDAFPANNGSGTASFASGVTTFTDGSSALHWLRAGDQIVIGGDTVSVASTPTPSSFTVAGDYHTATTWARKAPWNTANMVRRLYRTTGTTGAFELVADGITATTYSDVLTDSQILGDELISQGWFPPPANLIGLIVHSSGSLMGISGNQVCMTEPFQPHAWNPAYQLSTDYDGVGMATYGSTVIVATQGYPHAITGVDPSSMSMEKVTGTYPCLAKRSITSVGNAVVYASRHGLINVGDTGLNVVTDGVLDKDEWFAYNPANMISEFAYGRIYISTIDSNNINRILVLDPNNFNTVDIEAYDLFADKATGELYVATKSDISVWDSPAAVPMQGSWKSKIFMFPAPVNLGAAKIEYDLAIDEDARQAIINQIAAIKTANDAVIATGLLKSSYDSFAYDSRRVDGSLLLPYPDMPPSNELTFVLYYNKKAKYSRVVKSSKAFTLPSGIKSDTVEFQISGQCAINEVRLAETMEGLKQV